MRADVFVPPPGHLLHPFVHSIFEVHGPQAALREEAILPKGNVDLLFNLGAPVDVAREGAITTIRAGAVQVAGLQTSRFDTRLQGATCLLGISLRMETAAAILRIPQHDVTDHRVDAACILPGTASLIDRLAAAPGFDARRRLLLQWAASRVRSSEIDRLVVHACASLTRRPDAPIAALARSAGMSPRQFQRRFNDAVGLAPARYVKMRRFIRAVHLIPHRPTLADVACEAGYADQAHFCRDFRELASMSPDVYRRRATAVPGHVWLDAGGMSDSFKTPGPNAATMLA